MGDVRCPHAVGAGGQWLPERGALRGFSYAVGTAGNGGLPSRGPISWEEMGERTPGGGGSSPGTPFSGGVVWGKAVLLTGYLACGPHSERPVAARPPAGRAGDVGEYPLGEGGENPFGFPLSPSVNRPLLPPARAGGRAMRRWSWRPQARPIPTQPPSPVPLTREWGSKGKEPPSPWCSFPYFFKEIGPRLGSQGSLPFQRPGEGTPQRTLPGHPKGAGPLTPPVPRSSPPAR